jgi:hypothetical protein
VIKFNIKEPIIYEYNGILNKVFIYNRFLDKFFNTEESYNNKVSYIKNKSKKKNFIYINSPRKIDLFVANEIKSNLDKVDSNF